MPSKYSYSTLVFGTHAQRAKVRHFGCPPVCSSCRLLPPTLSQIERKRVTGTVGLSHLPSHSISHSAFPAYTQTGKATDRHRRLKFNFDTLLLFGLRLTDSSSTVRRSPHVTKDWTSGGTTISD